MKKYATLIFKLHYKFSKKYIEGFRQISPLIDGAIPLWYYLPAREILVYECLQWEEAKDIVVCEGEHSLYILVFLWNFKIPLPCIFYFIFNN